MDPGSGGRRAGSRWAPDGLRVGPGRASGGPRVGLVIGVGFGQIFRDRWQFDFLGLDTFYL